MSKLSRHDSFSTVSIHNNWFHYNVFIHGYHCIAFIYIVFYLFIYIVLQCISVKFLFCSDPLPLLGWSTSAFILSVCPSVHPPNYHLPINLDSATRRNMVFFFLTPPLFSLAPLPPTPLNSSSPRRPPVWGAFIHSLVSAYE